jgi:hypothetical protein
MNEALATKLKYLHLGQLLAHWDDYLKLAGDQRFSHARLLTHVVEEQYRIKREQLRQLRLRKAHVPEPWVIETFPFDRQPKLNVKKIMALYDSLTTARSSDYHDAGMSGSRSRLAHQRRQAMLCEQRIPGRKDADFASKESTPLP